MNTFGRAQLQRVEDRRQIVDTHVTESAAAEIPPAAPLERAIGRMVGTLGSGAEPQVPVEVRRHRLRFRGALYALGPPERQLSCVGRAVGPDMSLAHGSD